MDGRRFTKNDSGFTCAHCGAQVEPLGYTSRDHCPRCLHSLHVDDNPGDRNNDCLGDLVPIGLELNKKGYVLIFRCAKCGAIKKNVAARDDDSDALIALSAIEVKINKPR